MRRNIFRITAIMATALLAFTAGGCVEPLDPSQRGPIDPDAVSLPIRLYIPGAMPATKALTGDVESVSTESHIYSVQVWMFNHYSAVHGDNEKAVAYTQSTINWTPAENIEEGSGYYTSSSGHWDGDIYELPMVIPSNILDRADADLRFDFFILANGSSIGNPASSDATRSQLKAMTFGKAGDDDYFGTTGTTNPTMAVPSSGLPISGFFNEGKDDTDVTGAQGVDLSFLKPAKLSTLTPDQIREKTPVVQLKRAVSKIRFVFSRPTDLTGVSITGVELDAGTILDQTFVFENSTIQPDGVSYNSAAAPLGITLATNAIGQILDPTVLTSTYFETHQAEGATATAQSYDDYLTDAINHKETVEGSVTDAPQATEKVVYLRESDKAITGKIYYKLTDNQTTPTEATFTMEGLANTNFHRNHSWIVYAYFVGGELFVRPVVADWVDVTPDLEYTLKMNTNMRLFDSWLYRYDTDYPTNPDTYADWSKWPNSHMVVSEGRVTETTTAEPVVGRPLRSPQIQLVTTGVADASVPGSGTFELKVDNTDFEILRANKNATGVVTSYEASTNGILTIPDGDDVYTYFYIVPKATITSTNPPANRVAKVSLVYNDPVLGPVKVTFNYSTLPGYSDDSSEIWAYYFPADDYRIIRDANNKPDKLRMYFQDYNNPLVPTPVQ